MIPRPIALTLWVSGPMELTNTIVVFRPKGAWDHNLLCVPQSLLICEEVGPRRQDSSVDLQEGVCLFTKSKVRPPILLPLAKADSSHPLGSLCRQVSNWAEALN